MKKHKIFLEDLAEEMKSLSEYYQLTYEDGEAFELKASEVKPFTEELLAAIKKYIIEETTVDEEDTDTEDDDDYDMFLLDVDDDLS
ncbi:hypothetical protein CN918_26650 [Priestia megaterium]|nr:hypothetical protein CN918_26650 [Priestia megaterium]